jgi:hypothetical protein
MEKLFDSVTRTIITQGLGQIKRIVTAYGAYSGCDKKALKSSFPDLAARYLLTNDGRKQLLDKVLNMNVDGPEGDMLANFLVTFS